MGVSAKVSLDAAAVTAEADEMKRAEAAPNRLSLAVKNLLGDSDVTTDDKENGLGVAGVVVERMHRMMKDGLWVGPESLAGIGIQSSPAPSLSAPTPAASLGSLNGTNSGQPSVDPKVAQLSKLLGGTVDTTLDFLLEFFESIGTSSVTDRPHILREAKKVIDHLEPAYKVDFTDRNKRLRVVVDKEQLDRDITKSGKDLDAERQKVADLNAKLTAANTKVTDLEKQTKWAKTFTTELDKAPDTTSRGVREALMLEAAKGHTPVVQSTNEAELQLIIDNIRASKETKKYFNKKRFGSEVNVLTLDKTKLDDQAKKALGVIV